MACILSLLIFFLSCLPCADAGAIPSGVKQETGTTQHHEHRDQGPDLCSPFCHCSCCSTFSIINIPVVLPARATRNVTPAYALHLAEKVFDISLPVWQPPQLV